MDNLSQKQRKRCMKGVKSKNTKPERVLRRALWAGGFRYRLKTRVFGKPDLVFPGKRVAVFIDGCFWHGCTVHKNIPRTNHAFWAAKIAKNQARDLQVTQTLTAEGWTVLRFWEHDIKKDLPRVLAKIQSELSS